MKIKEIELYNFRIYYGINKIEFNQSNERNINIISGKNGYGKTTLLMSLVWCLYGKQMEHVDDMYNKEISDQGGYPRYITNSLNREARADGDNLFYVSILFTDINIPEFPCKELRIKRQYNINSSKSENIEVYFDNNLKQEESEDYNPESFIRDFILPKEIAKFFFFDAEKIVNLAEITTNEQRKKLSIAYSEVLGIKKYEDLKNELEDLQIRIKKNSASAKERADLNILYTELKNIEIKIEDKDKKIEEKKDLKKEYKYESNKLQEKLIRAGSSITIEELQRLKDEEQKLADKLSEVQGKLRDFYDIIPFLIAGRQMYEIFEQLEAERSIIVNRFKIDKVKDITEKILTDLFNERPDNLIITNQIHEYYKSTFAKLIKKYFFEDVVDNSEDIKIIHEFSEVQKNDFDNFLSNIRNSFKEEFKKIANDYSSTRSELSSLRRRLKDAESQEEDSIIAADRKKKEELDIKINRLEDEIEDEILNKGQFENSRIQIAKQHSELTKKIGVSEQYKDKDQMATRLIKELKSFIADYKIKKKESLENHIKNGLNKLMHKKDFITNVTVDIGDDYMDIDLYNRRNEIIKKESLSKGEQQMYATALLTGLVEESDIEFPVFIDSPMQKFDDEHAENIVKHFYPQIAEQVVIFPLINKELTIREFDLLKKNISKTFLIDNIESEKSKFIEIDKNEFFQIYREKYNYVN